MTGRWAGPPLDADQAAVVDVVDGFACGPLRQLRDRNDVAGARRALAALDLWAVAAPSVAGGAGASPGSALVVLERLARVWPVIAVASAHAQAAAMILAGEPRWLVEVQAICGGAPAVVVDGEGDGVDVTLERDDHGYRIAGAAARIDVGPGDPLLVVLASLDGASDPMAVIVPAERRGAGDAAVRFGDAIARTGLDGAHSRPVDFGSAFFLTGDHVVEGGAGVTAARSFLRFALAAVAAGVAGAAADAAERHVHERHQFGAPLVTIPTIRSAVTDAHGSVRRALNDILSGSRDPVEAGRVLRSAAREATTVTAGAVQLHGGYGYLSEYEVERLFRDAVSLRAVAASLIGRAS